MERRYLVVIRPEADLQLADGKEVSSLRSPGTDVYHNKRSRWSLMWRSSSTSTQRWYYVSSVTLPTTTHSETPRFSLWRRCDGQLSNLLWTSDFISASLPFLGEIPFVLASLLYGKGKVRLWERSTQTVQTGEHQARWLEWSEFPPNIIYSVRKFHIRKLTKALF